MKNKSFDESLYKDDKPTFTTKDLKEMVNSSFKKAIWILFLSRLLAMFVYKGNDFWINPLTAPVSPF
jgi:hypothetical protein